MQTSIWWLGYVTAALLAAILVCAGVVAVLRGVELMFMRWHSMGEVDGFRRAQDRLMQNSWWFSEDLPTMTLLQRLSADGYDVSNLREQWRKSRSKAPIEEP